MNIEVIESVLNRQKAIALGSSAGEGAEQVFDRRPKVTEVDAPAIGYQGRERRVVEEARDNLGCAVLRGAHKRAVKLLPDPVRAARCG